MTTTEALKLTSRELHTNLLQQLLGCLELTKNIPEPTRSTEIAQTAFLIAKEVYGHAREMKQVAIDTKLN